MARWPLPAVSPATIDRMFSRSPQTLSLVLALRVLALTLVLADPALAQLRRSAPAPARPASAPALVAPAGAPASGPVTSPVAVPTDVSATTLAPVPPEPQSADYIVAIV